MRPETGSRRRSERRYQGAAFSESGSSWTAVPWGRHGKQVTFGSSVANHSVAFEWCVCPSYVSATQTLTSGKSEVVDSGIVESQSAARKRTSGHRIAYLCGGSAGRSGATSEQQRPSNREDRAPSGTRRRSQALATTALYGLQTSIPRFKCGRRLQSQDQ